MLVLIICRSSSSSKCKEVPSYQAPVLIITTTRIWNPDIIILIGSIKIILTVRQIILMDSVDKICIHPRPKITHNRPIPKLVVILIIIIIK